MRSVLYGVCLAAMAVNSLYWLWSINEMGAAIQRVANPDIGGLTAWALNAGMILRATAWGAITAGLGTIALLLRPAAKPEA